jgi:hypothetical protein
VALLQVSGWWLDFICDGDFCEHVTEWLQISGSVPSDIEPFSYTIVPARLHFRFDVFLISRVECVLNHASFG